MTVYLVRGFPDLLDKPGGTALVGLFGNMTAVGTGNVSGDFVEVKVGDQTGWVSKDSLVVKDRDVLDEVAFVRESIIAERAVNALSQTAPWFVSADYVIARAIFESQDIARKLVNAGNKIPGSDTVGPLQMSTAEWQTFLANGGTLAADFGTASVDDYLAQAWGAAFTMFTDAKAITQVKLDAGQGSNADPPLPSYLEIFLAYLTTSPKAATSLAAAAATPADKGQDGAQAGIAGAGAGVAPAAPVPQGASKLNDFLKNTAVLRDDQIETLFKARPGLTGTNDANAKTVGDFVNSVSTALGQALRDAADLIAKDAPETVAAIIGTGGAPWMTVATAERNKGIKEGTAAGDAEILSYFQSINIQAKTSATPWCAAFVSFCMKTSGNQVAADSIPKTAPALAASWKGWGSPLPANASTTPQGAVVVLSPTEDQDDSGHVGFFVSGNTDTITLLGGNQTNAVKESTYARSRVAAIRWLDVAQPAAAGPVAAGPINLSRFNAKQQAAAKIIIDRFAASGFGSVHQITAVANAWKESSLNPSEQTHTSREDSIGLFQLNMRSGLGVGHQLNDLLDATKNTDIIIDTCKSVPEFKNAQDLAAAVTAFVRFVEKPANQPAEIIDRLQKAKSLEA
ncbi:TIGR02594 family protein [Mesorhizobium loti]|uniref:TIGR02594 family protein n=1 Tax=Mesorhizobium loti R88b TaxID=935548 RepID=A0A6M7WC15_RHILI|nr:TIGR02594 family protein [Mesorhizobium loti]QKD01270.1 TIGR02594 family protein [Mesorhizobium loti R88b]